ncbi:MAG: ThiF family adenylyltransferase [Pseudomonadota bacterium]|nr:ThiF family adenylyltransferase [Pseudomonadota bacterium]
MFQKLVSHNDDIRRLVERGYAVAFDTGYMIIRDIPYLDDQLQLHNGAIVTKLEFIDQEHVRQQNHQIFFAGSAPYNLDKKLIPNLADRPTKLALDETCKDVVVQRSFSNKPMGSEKFTDFFEKINSYVEIISGPAIELYNVTPYTFRCVNVIPESVFKFHDTLTSLAEISDLSTKFKNDTIAVIGLGGTGSYILDFLIKTPVREIRAFDGDSYHVHNAFRSPGRLENTELGKDKATIYQSRYENFRSGLSFQAKFIDLTSKADLEGVTFAFVCVDKGSSRSEIFDLLIGMKIPFIDVGMGLNRKSGLLNGMLRTTYYSTEQGDYIRNKGLASVIDDPNDLYRNNIQISELNALNACLAVIKFKQLRGFYFEESPIFNLLFEVGDLKTAEDSEINED